MLNRDTWLFLIFVSLLLSSCDLNVGKEQQSENQEARQPDRNMFGLGIERGLTVQEEGLDPGYVLFVVPNSASVYLMDRDAQVVHEWKGNYGVLGAYLSDDGSLHQNVYDPDFLTFAGGGETGRLQHITWDSKIVWDYEYNSKDYHAHHDFEVMPNGNILAIAWESRSADESIAQGRNPEQLPSDGLWPDKVVEIKPIDKYTGEVVWEWHMWDHLIQDFDPSKKNYGKLEDHPELIDINAGWPTPPPITQDSMDIIQARGQAWRNQTAGNRGSDLFHCNAISYNPDLDLIVVSSPGLGEIFVIDHSTTTAQAAGHRGGRYGKGGDLLYRWGNPQNYQRGDSTNQKLFGQHDVRWVEKGKPGEGNLTVFNNNVPNGPDSMAYSAVYELELPLGENSEFLDPGTDAWGPEAPVWKYIAEDSISFYSSFISGAHRMRNGNTFINEGAKGRFFEVTPNGKVVWEYLSQHRGQIRKLNGDPLPDRPMMFSAFRSTFIPADHPGIEGRDLKPLDPQPAPYAPEEIVGSNEM